MTVTERLTSATAKAILKTVPKCLASKPIPFLQRRGA